MMLCYALEQFADFRRLIIGSMVWMTVLMAVFVYVVGSYR